jgi:hypothetical protein
MSETGVNITTQQDPGAELEAAGADDTRRASTPGTPQPRTCGVVRSNLPIHILSSSGTLQSRRLSPSAGCDDAAVDASREVPLRGGRSTPGVVRLGDTVRRPLKPDAARIHRLLAHLERSGFDGAPQFLGVDARGRTILSFIDGFAPPHNGFRLSEQGVRAGARLVRRVHDLTEGTEFAAGSEVACHPNLSQPNFIFRDMIPVAIIDWDGTAPGTRLSNFGEFLWAFVHPAVYGEGEAAARMLRVAADAYGWSGGGLVDAMLTTVRNFEAVVAGDRGAMDWAAAELAYMKRNADLFRARLSV